MRGTATGTASEETTTAIGRIASGAAAGRAGASTSATSGRRGASDPCLLGSGPASAGCLPSRALLRGSSGLRGWDACLG